MSSSTVMGKRRVLVLFPNLWDVRQLASCQADWAQRFELLFAEPTAEDCPHDLDVPAYIAETVERYRDRIDGVFSSNDYPGATVAAAVGSALGLPSPGPLAALKTAHKFYSRQAQRESAPEATADFWLVDSRCPEQADDLVYPVFVKPVKGSFSVHSRKIHSHDELVAFLRRPVIRDFTEDYLAIFNSMVALAGLDVDGRYFLAESFLHGTQVTVEGFSTAAGVEVFGIVDSVLHKDTGSFARFDYPSALRAEIQEQMADIARRVVGHLGLCPSHFNIEMIYDPATDDIRIIEINARICGQFADLYAKVDGTNSYIHALEVATGGTPVCRVGAGRHSQASSFPLRVFEPAIVRHAPSAEQIRAVEADDGDTLVWLECETGMKLDDFATWEDGCSARYAIVNTAADSRRGLRDRLAAVEKSLGIELEKITTS